MPRLVMTLKVRDEADVIEANLRYHVAQGVDFFVVTDNGSSDGTLDVLQRYRDAGLAHLIEEPAGDFKRRGKEWVTRMARLAATAFDADWVINCDADEFWWPVSGTLEQAFASVPERYSLVNAPRPEFVARPDAPGDFVERLVHREAHSRLQHKVAHRASPDVVVGRGSHKIAIDDGDDAAGARHSGRAVLRTVTPQGAAARRPTLIPAPCWPARILHFPVRSYEQYRRRVEVILFHGGYEPRPRHKQLRRHYEGGRLPELYAELVLDDAELGERLADGTLVADRGLRDFMAGCPDPLGAAGVSAAREWAVGATRLPAETAARERAANEADMMEALDRADRSVRRQRRQANRRVAQLKRERRELSGRVRELERERDRLRSRLAAATVTPWNRARALAGRVLRRG